MLQKKQQFMKSLAKRKLFKNYMGNNISFKINYA